MQDGSSDEHGMSCQTLRAALLIGQLRKDVSDVNRSFRWAAILPG